MAVARSASPIPCRHGWCLREDGKGVAKSAFEKGGERPSGVRGATETPIARAVEVHELLPEPHD